MIAPHLPERFHDSIYAYIERGRPVGSFLGAVLGNDLKEALARADYDSVLELPGLVGWLYNTAPGRCWGSYEAVEAWIKGGGFEGICGTDACWEGR